MPALWETDTETGRRLMQAWDGEGCVFIVVRSFELYQELEKLNGTSMCRWLSTSALSGDGGDGNDDDDDTESTSTIKTDATAPDIGVICLRAPQFSYEKNKAGLPTCFLFGRKAAKRRVDVFLGRGGKTSLSRIHFALGIKGDVWAVRNLCDFETVVNRDTPLGPGSPGFALRPDQGNAIQVADIVFEVYCRGPRVAATYLADSSLPPELPFDGTDPTGTSSMTTADAAQGVDLQRDPDPRRYIFQHERLESRTQTPKFLALDAWTCIRYAAKQYPPSHEPTLRTHLELLAPIPPRAPFMREELLHHNPEAPYLLTRYREDLYTLEEVRELATTQLARRLLRNLLKTVAQLHRLNIVHNDICLSTVFVVGSLDPDSNLDNILLSGFSEASADMTRARNDCFQVFRTIREFLDQGPKLPRCWTGDEHLDRLWHHLSESGSDSWPCTAQEICRLSDISTSPDVGEPKTIPVSKTFHFRHSSDQDVSYLLADDVKEYLSKDAVRCAGKAPSLGQIKSLTREAFTALEPCIRDGRITVKDYCYFREHLKERHSKHSLGLRLFMSLPNHYYINRPIQFNISFPVPYLSRYGLINLEYLGNLASMGFNPSILKHLLPHCYEVRGFLEARGVYISIEHLDLVTERLGLRAEEEHGFEAADTLLEDYTYEGWYLLAPNPMSKIFPVKRSTNQVLTSPSPPTYTPLRRFLEDHFEAKCYLDSQVIHDPEKLFVADAATEKVLPHSCGGSVEAASDDSQVLRFRRSHLPKPSLLVDIKEKRRADATDAWLLEQEEARSVRRRRHTGNRADITPTDFVARDAS